MARNLIKFIFFAISFAQGCANVKPLLKKIERRSNDPRNLEKEMALQSSTEFNGNRGDPSSFLSITLNARISPFHDEMTKAEETIFQSGVREFLEDALEEEANIKNIYVVSCMITKRDFPDKKNPETLRLQHVISAQIREMDGDKIFSEEEFGDIIVNVLNIFDDKLINLWREYENNSMIGKEETELKFNTVETVVMELKQPETPKKKISLTTIIILSHICASLFMWALMMKRKRSKVASDSASGSRFPFSNNKLSTDKNIQDLVQQHGDDNNITVPYPEAEMVQGGISKGKTKKYSKIVNVPKPRKDRRNNEDHEYGNIDLNGSSSGEIVFDDNDTILSKLSGEGSITAECFAPPGKLGVAIDTINGQPVVHRVRDFSPLAGVLRRLDIIIAVDDVKTTSMSAAEVTSLMAKKMGKTRKITYMRGEEVQQFLLERQDSFH